VKSVIVKDRPGAVDILKDYIGHTLKDVRVSDGTHVEQMEPEILLEFSNYESPDPDEEEHVNARYPVFYHGPTSGFSKGQFKINVGRVLKQYKPNASYPHDSFVFEDVKDNTMDSDDLLTIAEQKEVLRCFRARSEHGNSLAYDNLHTKLCERYLPDVDGGE